MVTFLLRCLIAWLDKYLQNEIRVLSSIITDRGIILGSGKDCA